MASSQHRRVFVGNIPYDATEEQLIQICEEVGPVVSFRLVVDRETGKPKGYGFCEYKDEETALSARRNLQGYEINGRQLRVDFAENDKGSDRNREQGRGGPGASTIADVNKQVGGPAVVLDATLNQQIGLPLAMTAASVMAGALGGSQGGGPSNSNGPPQQPLLGNDPLTTHLAKMSKSQLIQVMSEMKVLATQNYDLAQQLLVVCPQLPKALFQAQIMLGMVTPQMLQMPNIRSASVPFSQTSLQGHQNQQSTPTTIHGLPPMAPLTSAPQNSLVSNQFPASIQFPTQARAQVPNLTQKGPQENLIAVHSIANTLPSARPQPLGGMPSGPSMRPVQAPLLQNAGFGGTGNSGLAKQSVSGGSMLPGSGFQTGSLLRPAALDTNRNAAMVPDGTFAGRTKPNPSTLIGSSNRNDSLAQCGRPSKLVKLENGRASTFSPGDFPVTSTSNAKLPNAAGIGVITASQSLRSDEPQNLETRANQVQLLPDIDSALLQQVKNLTPEQLSTLPPEQQQQVLQLQKMLH